MNRRVFGMTIVGLTAFSMTPRAIPAARHLVASVSVAELRAYTNKTLTPPPTIYVRPGGQNLGGVRTAANCGSTGWFTGRDGAKETGRQAPPLYKRPLCSPSVFA